MNELCLHIILILINFIGKIADVEKLIQTYNLEWKESWIFYWIMIKKLETRQIVS